VTADRARQTLFLLGHPTTKIAFRAARFEDQVEGTDRAHRLPHGRRRGAGDAGHPEHESVRALASLGVASAEIHFLGKDLSVPDGLLFRRLTPVYDALEAECSSIGSLGEIYTLGWEGGNLDHDAAHVIGLALAVARDRVHRAWQVAFYRAAGLGHRSSRCSRRCGRMDRYLGCRSRGRNRGSGCASSLLSFAMGAASSGSARCSSGTPSQAPC
jgi:hypothetical protein